MQSLAPDIGNATMTAHWIGGGLGTLTYAAGTEVNAQPGYDAIWALAFIDIDTVFSDHRITITGLDFTGLTDVSFSYAVTSTEIFDFGESASVSYRIGAGSWSDPVPIALPDNEWSIRMFSFGSALDGMADVSVRIDHHAVFEMGSSLRFDNVTVQAVPEPSAFALGLAGLGLVAAGVLRRRR